MSNADYIGGMLATVYEGAMTDGTPALSMCRALTCGGYGILATDADGNEIIPAMYSPAGELNRTVVNAQILGKDSAGQEIIGASGYNYSSRNGVSFLPGTFSGIYELSQAIGYDGKVIHNIPFVSSSEGYSVRTHIFGGEVYLTLGTSQSFGSGYSAYSPLLKFNGTFWDSVGENSLDGDTIDPRYPSAFYIDNVADNIYCFGVFELYNSDYVLTSRCSVIRQDMSTGVWENFLEVYPSNGITQAEMFYAYPISSITTAHFGNIYKSNDKLFIFEDRVQCFCQTDENNNKIFGYGAVYDTSLDTWSLICCNPSAVVYEDWTYPVVSGSKLAGTLTFAEDSIYYYGMMQHYSGGSYSSKIGMSQYDPDTDYGDMVFVEGVNADDYEDIEAGRINGGLPISDAWLIYGSFGGNDADGLPYNGVAVFRDDALEALPGIPSINTDFLFGQNYAYYDSVADLLFLCGSQNLSMQQDANYKLSGIVVYDLTNLEVVAEYPMYSITRITPVNGGYIIS